MLTRVRIEAEGSTPDEVTQILQTAHEMLVVEGSNAASRVLYGDPDRDGAYPGLADAQAGEFVIERFARDTRGAPGHGGIVYRGRMTAHYAKPQRVKKLNRHHEDPNLAGYDL